MYYITSEAQDASERELPKSPIPSTPSPVGRHPGSPPYTPPVYAAQPHMNSVSRNQPFGSMTSPIKKDITSPSVNGDSPFIQNCEYS